MKFTPQALRWVSLVALAAILYSCSPYLAREIPKEPLPAFDGKIVNLFWPEQESRRIKLTGVTVENSALIGQAEVYEEENPYNYGNHWIDVHVSEQVRKPAHLPCEMSIPIADIQKIEIYDPSVKHIAGNILMLGATEFVIMSMVIVLIMAFKESCPFVYAWNGEDYALAGETYSGAIFPHLERHDYLPLPELRSDQGVYRIKLTNEVKEEQHTNLAELIVVDHPPGTSVLMDKYGRFLSFSDPRLPESARGSDGADLAPLLCAKDELRYLGGDSNSSDSAADMVFLSFKRPPAAESAKLLIRGKSSLWLDYTLAKWLDLFGDKYNSWYRQQSGKPGLANPNWAVEQGIQLSVFLQKNGSWEFVDYFNVTGPMADRDMVMSIDLGAVDQDEVKLMLSSGFMFWEIDYAALDFSQPCDLVSQALTLSEATDQRGKDVNRLLAQDDKRYQTLAKIGDEVKLSFLEPPADARAKRTVFLHGKGHYKILRDPSGPPELSYLEQFRNPGRLGQFSREKYLELRLQASSGNGGQ